MHHKFTVLGEGFVKKTLYLTLLAQYCIFDKIILAQSLMLCLNFAGHYCPRGTMSPTQFPCVEGTWTNLTNLISQEECYICPKGYFCLRGVSKPSGLCFTGHYCPRGMYKHPPFCILWLSHDRKFHCKCHDKILTSPLHQ